MLRRIGLHLALAAVPALAQTAQPAAPHVFFRVSLSSAAPKPEPAREEHR